MHCSRGDFDQTGVCYVDPKRMCCCYRNASNRGGGSSSSSRRSTSSTRKPQPPPQQPPPTPSVPCAPNARAYELAWGAFVLSKEPLSEANVPWPPISLEETLGVSTSSSIGGDGGRSGSVAGAAKKKAFKRFAKRWHPDKFLQKFGARFAATPPRDQVVIMARVTSLFQKVCGSI